MTQAPIQLLLNVMVMRMRTRGVDASILDKELTDLFLQWNKGAERVKSLGPLEISRKKNEDNLLVGVEEQRKDMASLVLDLLMIHLATWN